MPDEAALFCRTALLPEGWRDDVRVVFAHGLIGNVQVGVGAEPGDERCSIAVPGLANLHSHAFQRGLAGLAERRGASADSFWTWREAMYRFLDRMTPDDVEAISAQAYAEMLASGFTQVGEFHYLHHDPAGQPYADPAELAGRIAAAAAATGIGLSLLPSFYAHGDFGGAAPSPGQRRFVHDLDGFARLLERCRTIVATLEGSTLGIAPHSLRAVTGEELAALVALSPGGPIHIHAAEQQAEVASCLATTGLAPVAWLLAHHEVGPRWCLIHATHMSADETAALALTGAAVGLCPLTEASLGDGVFPGATFQAAGGRFGVGTDSNILIDAAGELRQMEYAQRLMQRARNVLADGAHASTGRSLFDRTLRGGAQALGLGAGGIVAGTGADVVTLRADHPSLVGRSGDLLLDGWIFAAGGGVVDAVWRAGRCVVRDGRHLKAGAIAARYAACLRGLLTP